MTQKPTYNPPKKTRESNFLVIMESKPAIILEKRQAVEMSHGVYIFENILHLKTNSPIGIRIYAKLPAIDIDTAISQARGVTDVILAQFSFLTKTSIPDLRIMKAYEATPRKKSGKFIEYYYDLPFASESERILDSSSLRKSSEVIIGLGAKDNGRVTRAFHWFRRATKSTDLLERFTLLWIGLETINLTLCKHYGVEVEYSTCDCCKKNVPMQSGVKKLLKDIGDKNLGWRKISKLRATTLHGAKQLHEIIPSLRETVPSLQDALYTALNLICGLDGSNESIRNIGSPLQGHFVSTATIEGPDLQLIDKVIIPRFDYQIGVVYLPEGKQELCFEHKPVIDDDFKFEGELHSLLASPNIGNKYTFEVDGQ